MSNLCHNSVTARCSWTMPVHLVWQIDTLLTKVGSLDAFKLSNLLLLFLPPNCTSVVQPLDQGIIAAFKDLQALSLKTNLKQVCVFLLVI